MIIIIGTFKWILYSIKSAPFSHCYSSAIQAFCFLFFFIHLEQILLIFEHKNQELLEPEVSHLAKKEHQRIEISKLIFHINDFGINAFRNQIGSCKLMRKETLHMNQDRSLNVILSIIPSIKCDVSFSL